MLIVRIKVNTRQTTKSKPYQRIRSLVPIFLFSDASNYVNIYFKVSVTSSDSQTFRLCVVSKFERQLSWLILTSDADETKLPCRVGGVNKLLVWFCLQLIPTSRSPLGLEL